MQCHIITSYPKMYKLNFISGKSNLLSILKMSKNYYQVLFRTIDSYPNF